MELGTGSEGHDEYFPVPVGVATKGVYNRRFFFFSTFLTQFFKQRNVCHYISISVGLAQSVQRRANGVRFLERQKVFLFSTASRPALVQPPIQLVPGGDCFPGVKVAEA
jgi:hypothetical protein